MDAISTEKRRITVTTLTVIGMLIMVLLSLTQLIPSLRLAKYSVLVGIAFFFIVEAVAKTPKDRSGLRFKSFFADLKKPGELPLILLPVVTAIVPFLLDKYVLHMGFAEHVMGRTDGILSFENTGLLILQVIVFALGEEIAWRGFFVGKSMQKYPFWFCAVVSSVLFACGHLASGGVWVVLYDVCLVFIDSMIFAAVYRKSGNCLVSTLSHIIGNAVGIAFSLLIL